MSVQSFQFSQSRRFVSLRAVLTVLTVLSVVLAVLGVFSPVAGARTVAVSDPAQNCVTADNSVYSWTLSDIDACRAAEGIGPMILPTNWTTLTTSEQLLVLIDLERVNRGLAPVVGLSPAINALAKQGAVTNDDPPFPSIQHGLIAAGGIWAGVSTVLDADYAWMYDDGYSPNNTSINLDCPTQHAQGCWGHRQVILMRSTAPLVGGGGYTPQNGYNSYAFENAAGYTQHNLTFTWKNELKHFTTKPTTEPLN